MANIFIERTIRDDIPMVNSTGADLAQFDFTVIEPYAVVAVENIVAGESGNFTIKGDLILQADEFVSGEDTFATVNAKVFFDPATKKFSDTSTAGYYHVGYVAVVKDANGMITFEKLRFATLVA